MNLTRNMFLFGLVLIWTVNTISGADNVTSTTPPSTSTTVPSSSTTPSPSTTTQAPHKDNMWVVKDAKTGRVCLVAQMKIQLDIPFKDSKTNKTVMSHVMVPGNAVGVGNCDTLNLKSPQSLLLTWNSENITIKNNVELIFSSNTTSKQFWLSSISASIVPDNKTFPNISSSITQIKLMNNSAKHFMTPFDNSYNCPSNVNIPASETPQVGNQTAFFTFEHFQLEAFKNSTTNNFSSAIFCEGDNTPDLVPILVGCTMVGLVVIVLGVYLWGRRRTQRGYHSM